jgi:hypothetical protein
MRRVFIMALCGYFPFAGSAQVVEKTVNKFISEHKVDTCMVYSVVCYGGIALDTCAIEGPRYLFWKADGKYCLKRFDYCKKYPSMDIDSTNPLHFYLKYRKKIDSEQIRPPTKSIKIIRKNGKVVTITEISMRDHSCHPTFLLHLGSRSFTKSADEYNLDFLTFDDGKKNIYCDYNNNTKFKALIDLTSRYLKELETSGKFVVE